MLDQQIRRVLGHGAVQRRHDLHHSEHDHDDADDVIGPLEQHLGRVCSVHVAGERAQLVVNASQPSQRLARGRRVAGHVQCLDHVVDAAEPAGQHVVLHEHQYVDDHLAHAVEPVRDHHGRRHQYHVQVRQRRVRGQGRWRGVPDGPGQVAAVGHRHRIPGVVQELKRPFGARQPGELMPPPVEHGAHHVGRRADVPVEQLDQREAV